MSPCLAGSVAPTSSPWRRFALRTIFAVLALAGALFMAGQGAAQAQAIVSTDKTTYAPGETVNVRIIDDLGIDANYFVGLGDGSWSETFVLLGGGEYRTSFAAPASFGSYQITFSYIAQSGSFSGGGTGATFNVAGLSSRTLTLTASPTSTTVGQSIGLSASPSAGGGTPTYSVTSGSANCSVSNGTVTAAHAGTCDATASIPSDGTYAAVTTASRTLTFTLATQETLNVSMSPASLIYQGAATLFTTGGSGTGDVTYAVTSGPGFCSLNGSTVAGGGIGVCTVTATKAADSNYQAATGTLNITVGKAVQASLTASANPTSVNVAGTTALSISGGSGTGAVTYAVTTGSSFCTLNGSTLTGAATGACTVTATKAADEIYEAATATVIVTVSKASQAALTAAATSTSISYNGTASLSTSGGSGTGAVTYAVTNGSSYCSLNGSTLTGAGVGTCTVTATKLADATFDATTATVEVTVGKATQDALTVSANPTTVSFNGTTTLSTSGGGGTGAVTYAVTAGSSYCTLNGATLTGAGVGICTITATKAADANYQANAATLDVTVGKAAQAALTVSASPTGVNFNGTSTLSSSGGSGTGAVTYAVTVGSSFCSLNGATLTGIGAGTCTITATKAADTTYQLATATVDVTVASASQTITFNAPTGATVGATATLSATATSNLVVTFASQTTSICTVASSTVTYLTVGSCQIMASQVGDANWQAATPVTRTITIGVAATTTALTADNTAPVLGRSVMLTATVTRGAGSVALTGSVTFKDGSTTLATVNLSAGVATLSVSTLSAGSHSITAVFSGDTNYATSTSNAVTVTPSRPNPANDAKVRALVANQIQTAQRIASQQVDTVNRRLEMLHEDNVPGFVNGVSVVPPGDVRAYSATDPTPLAGQGSKLAAVKALDENARPGAALGDKGKGLRPDYYIWTAGAITTARDKIDGLPDKTRTTSQSVTVGVDTWLLAGVKAGVAFGGYTSHGKIDDFGTKDRARAFTGTAYASWNMGDGVFLDGALGYGDARFKSTRYDANASGLLTGSRNGDMVFGSLTASWDQKSGQLKYAPYARFDFSHAWLDRYAEQGDASWALAFDKTTVSSQAAVLGLRGQYDIANGSGTVSPTVRVEYRHAFNGDATQSMSYVADPSTAYGLTVNGSKRDTVTGSLGLKAQGDGALSGQIEYSAGLAVQGGGFAGHGLRGSIRLGF